MESVVPNIVRESATGKAGGKKWMAKNMNTQYAFVTNGRLHDKPSPTLVFQDCMGTVKGVRRHHPDRNTLTQDAAMPLALPLATSYETLLRPLLAPFNQYSQSAAQPAFVMVLCFDHYGVENAAKTVCHELRDELSDEEPPNPILPQEEYICDWERPLPENWSELLSSRDIAMPIVLRDITKAIVCRQSIPPSQKLIICGHSLDLRSVQRLADDRRCDRHWTIPGPGTEIRTLPLVLEHDRAYFDDGLRVEQIEGDLQIFSLLRALATRKQDIVHIISKDTDIMYYALWYAASAEMLRVDQLLWKHQWSREGDSWVDIYRLCETISSDHQLGSTRFQQAVKNLVVCLVATGTDYSGGYQNIGHIKWMKPMMMGPRHFAPLFGDKAVAIGEKGKAEHQQPLSGLNSDAYRTLASVVLGPQKMAANPEVIQAMACHLDYYIRCFLQSVGSAAQPDHLSMEDFQFDATTKRRLYKLTPSSSSSSSKDEQL